MTDNDIAILVAQNPDYVIFNDFFTYLIHQPDLVNILDGFHIHKVLHVKRDDEYYCGICSDNFCVKIGTTEVDIPGFKYINDNDYLEKDSLIIIEGNHKGNLYVAIIAIPNVLKLIDE